MGLGGERLAEKVREGFLEEVTFVPDLLR